MPKGSEEQRVGGEWSAVETLRHLVFMHDSWFRRCCLGSTEPFTAIGLAAEFVRDQEEQGLDRAAAPSLAEVLAVRDVQRAELERWLSGVTPDELSATAPAPTGSGWPPYARGKSVLECVASTWCWTRSGRTTVSACATSIYSPGDPRQVCCGGRTKQLAYLFMVGTGRERASCRAARWRVCAAASGSDHRAGRGQGPLSAHDVQGLGEARRATSAYIERRASSCHKRQTNIRNNFEEWL
jgi:hypothetical protein